MIGLIAGLLISWLLLWLFERSSLTVLGLLPTRHRILDFAFGFITSSLFCGICLFLIAVLSDTTLKYNVDFTLRAFFDSTFWMIKSVLMEELLFRGALLYIAIKILGLRNACILSSVTFGVYHWFSYGIFGNIPQMIYVFVLTSIAGLMFAYSFAVTKSIYLPVGLHLGWNIISVVIFSQGPLGDQLLVAVGGKPLNGFLTTLFFIYQVTLLPFATYVYLGAQRLVVMDNN